VGKLQRGEAIGLLREMADSPERFTPSWVSLANGEADTYELHIKPELVDVAFLEQVVKKRNLAMKVINGLIIIL
jgi:hypothetical protein